MTANQTTARTLRRLIAGVILSAAPLITIVSAAGAHADTTVSNPGPSFNAPAHHSAFPQQTDKPAPGTPAHHHHQHHGRG